MSLSGLHMLLSVPTNYYHRSEPSPAVRAAIEVDPWEAWILYGPNDGSTLNDWLADTVSEERMAELRETWRRRYARA